MQLYRSILLRQCNAVNDEENLGPFQSIEKLRQGLVIALNGSLDFDSPQSDRFPVSPLEFRGLNLDAGLLGQFAQSLGYFRVVLRKAGFVELINLFGRKRNLFVETTLGFYLAILGRELRPQLIHILLAGGG